MELRWAIFAGILFLNAAIAAVIAYLLRDKRRAPGGKEMLAVFVGLGIWTFAYGMITLSPTMEGKIFWLRVENIGIAGVPLLWFLFAARHTRRDKWLKWPLITLLLVIPVVSLVLIFSDRWFHLFYASVAPVSGNSGPLKIERGFWYFFSLVQNYALIATGAVLLFWHFIQFGRSYRSQLVTLMIAIAVPWLVNTFYQVGGRLFPVITIPIDLTPISFTITALMVSLSVFGLKLFDLIPIARSTVFENIPELVFVLDAKNRIVDANPAACMWVGKTRHEIIGQSAADVFLDWPELRQRYESIADLREEIEIPGEPPRTLDVTISGIYNRMNANEN
jgi:PAS domain-containing protein